MTFKELKSGMMVYILHHSDTISITQGKVVSVSAPRLPQLTPPYNQTAQMLVDVTVEENGSNKTYSTPETLDITYAEGIAISPNRESILNEVEMIKTRAEDVINSYEKNKIVKDQCETILAEWNPTLKERKATEERFGKLETQIGSLTDMVKSLVSKLS